MGGGCGGRDGIRSRGVHRCPRAAALHPCAVALACGWVPAGLEHRRRGAARAGPGGRTGCWRKAHACDALRCCLHGSSVRPPCRQCMRAGARLGAPHRRSRARCVRDLRASCRYSLPQEMAEKYGEQIFTLQVSARAMPRTSGSRALRCTSLAAAVVAVRADARMCECVRVCVRTHTHAYRSRCPSSSSRTFFSLVFARMRALAPLLSLSHNSLPPSPPRAVILQQTART